MKTHPLLSAFCITLAPWAAASQAQWSHPAASATPSVTFAPLSLSATAAPTQAPSGQRGMIGIYLAQDDERALVDGLVPGGPAEQSGMKAGDHITALDGQPVGGWQELSARVGGHHPGERLVVTVSRDGWSKEFEVTLAAAPEAPSEAVEVPGHALHGRVVEVPGRMLRAQDAPDALFEKRVEGQQGQVRVEGQPLTLRMRRSDDGSDTGAIRDRIVELRKAEKGRADAEGQAKSKSGQCCEKCGDCCAQGLGKVFSLGGGGGAWTLDLDDLEGKLPATIQDEDGQWTIGAFPTDLDVRVEGLPEKIQQHVRELGKGGAGHSGVHVFRVGEDGHPVQVEIDVETDVQGGAGDSHEVRVLREGALQGLSGHGAIRIEGLHGDASKMRVFTGKAGDGEAVKGIVIHEDGAHGSGGDAHEQGAGGELDQLRDELENLRQELRELRQALRRVNASGGTR